MIDHLKLTSDRTGEEPNPEFLLLTAEKAWNAWAKFRNDRQRNKRYTYGRQWDDMIYVDGRHITEEQYIREQGNLPLKNNLIIRLVRNVLGVFRNNWKNPYCVARDPREQPIVESINRLIECNIRTNRLQEIYSRSLEEFLISGFVVHRKWFGHRNHRYDCWTDFVTPDNFFMNTSTGDFRGWDTNCVGELHDLTFHDLCSYLACDYSQIANLHNIYRHSFDSDNSFSENNFGSGINNISFHSPSQPGLCRVIELWQRESEPSLFCHDTFNGKLIITSPDKLDEIKNINKERIAKNLPEITIQWRMTDVWRYYYLSPFGNILKSGVSPYPHKSHPYIFKAYPFIDGEIHSFVADVIDQQRYTNRLISLYDWIMRASAKGVLLFPEGCLPDGVDISDIADEWSRFNGVITYRPKAGVALPQQVSSNATNIGITELLNIQLKMFEDISGINGALQGKLDSTTMSGTLYDQQTRNSLTALRDLLESFNTFILDATEKDAINIRHFYSPQMAEAIAGKEAQGIFSKISGYSDSTIDLEFRLY